MAIRYWLLVHPLDRAQELVAAGIARGRWNSPDPVQQFREADGVVLYAPRAENPDGEPLRCAVNCGRVIADPMQAGGRGTPQWEARIDWLPRARLAPIRPLRDLLELTRNHITWGEQLRPGWVELSARDFTIFEDAVRPPAPEPGTLATGTGSRASASTPDGAPADASDIRRRAERAWSEWARTEGRSPADPA